MPKDWENEFVRTGIHYSRILFHTLFYNWAEEYYTRLFITSWIYLLIVCFSFLGKANIASSASSVFGSGFGMSTSKTESTSSLTPTDPQFLPSLIATSQPSNPIFPKNTSLTALVSSAGSTNTGSMFKLGDSVKQPSSTSLTFGGFSNLGPSTSTSSVSTTLSSKIFDTGNTNEIKTSTPSLTFGMAGESSLEGNSSISSAVSKPLFPVMSQSSSAFNTSKINKPQSRTAGMFGRAFATATEGLQGNETKEKNAEEKIRGLGTANLTSLVIKDIPEMYNKNAWLKRFYSRFGEVMKVVCTAARKSATITFKTHVSEGLYTQL